MSGHSKWAKIKHQKGVTDAKRGLIFTKLAKNIALSAKEGGGDPSMNFTLRLAIAKAKAVNMPAENIDRAVKKGVGGDDKTVVQRTSYEAMVGNMGLIIDCQTDNVNRTVSEVKRVIENAGAKMVNPGSVSWNFEEKGLINVRTQKIAKATKFGAEDSFEDINKENLELELMEIDGVLDIEDTEGEDDENIPYNYLEVYTSKNDLKSVSTEIEKRGYRIDSFEVIKISKEKINISTEERNKIENLVEALEEIDDVNEIWTNIK